MYLGYCPNCEAEISLDEEIEKYRLIRCWNCYLDLEVIDIRSTNSTVSGKKLYELVLSVED